MARDPIRLIMVDGDANNNKYYNMDDNGNGTFTATYGRVNQSKSEKIYSISDWDKVYHSKTKKGYKDVSHLKVTKIQQGVAPIADSEINDLLNTLFQKSRQFSGQYYNIETAVSTYQIDEAQQCINEMAKVIDMTVDDNTKVRLFNNQLNKIFEILPRKIKRVQDELEKSATQLAVRVQKEQSLLDNLAVQAVDLSKQLNTVQQQTFFDKYQFELSKPTQAEIDMVRDRLQKECGKTLSRMWVCRKSNRDDKLIEYLNNNNLTNTDKHVKLYWHGSDVQNIFSIAATGLVIRPANCGYNGSAFGAGIYHGPFSNKSVNYINYDIINGKKVGYLFLNAVAVGNMFKVHDNYDKIGNIRICDLDHNKFGQSLLGYHSIYAEANRSSYIRRDEVIIYNSEQVASRYLVEILY